MLETATSVGTALIASIVTGLATGLGVLPFLFMRELPRRVYDGILGVGAGLMLAAATLGLLGEALEGIRTDAGLDGGRLALVVTGFVAGVLVAAAMDRLIPHRHAGGHHEHLGHEPGFDRHDDHLDLHRVYVVIGVLSLHRIPEGLAIGAGFGAHAPRLGWLLAAAVAIQNACEGVVMAAPLRHAGIPRGRTLLLVVLTGLTIPLGALVGQALSTALAARALPFLLALAGGSLIYVTSNEVIPESHSHGHEGTASAGLMFGFLLTMLLDAVVH